MNSRIWSRILWSGIGLGLYAPIPLFAAFPGLAPAQLGMRMWGAPVGVWMVIGAILSITLATWICGAADNETKGPRT